MKVDLSIAPDATKVLSDLQKALAAAIASIPPLPADRTLLTTSIGGDFFQGEVSIPISPTAALASWAAEVTAKFNAFAVAK